MGFNSGFKGLITHEQFVRTLCSVLQDMKVKFSSDLIKHQPTKLVREWGVECTPVLILNGGSRQM